jgi:hypothetical protein
VDGVGVRAIAAKYEGLSKSAVERHVQHLPKSLRSLAEFEKQQAADALVTATPVLEQIRRLTARVVRIFSGPKKLRITIWPLKPFASTGRIWNSRPS